MDIDTFWDNLIENNIVSEDTLQVVISINGYSIDTLKKVLYVRTGYRSWEQYEEYENKN